ncbi:MAG: DUF402 domain-containing protein [Candidatus Acetothermia bacterium]|jgi:predicted RNA-binding protein associated with RNAse of E/G family|nr:DUF402 domain-containing protein [Candidatus Acetothermia bacterium]MDH7505365.1 DUF402 domain-containing protein [Candidatus Acetothermia bacterium]
MAKLKVLYYRGPGQVTVYEHELLYDDGKLIVSQAPFRPSASLRAQVPQLAAQEYRATWSVALGEWHDLGRVYDLAGGLVGYYCDIIRPVRRTAAGLEVEDLFLDLWVSPDGRYLILDEEEFTAARSRGWLDGPTAARAWEELARLIAEVRAGRFPPEKARDF